MMPRLVMAVLSLLAMSQTPQSGYVGENTCLSCHDAYRYKGKHAETTNARTPAATHGCESCHGAGRAHAEAGDPTAIKNPASMSVKEGIAACAGCHDRAAHPAAIGGQAPAADAACTWCHSVHHATAPKLLKVARR